MNNQEERIEKLEATLRQSTRDMNVMSQAMAEVLAWAKAAETNGLKAGTLDHAHNVVRIGHLRTEASTIRLTLEQISKGSSLPTLRKTLENRVGEIESQIKALGENSETA